MCISRSLNKDLVSQNVQFNQNVIAFYRTLTRRKWSTPSVYPIVKKSVLGSFVKKIAEKLALLAKIAVLKFIKSKVHFLVVVKFFEVIDFYQALCCYLSLWQVKSTLFRPLTQCVTICDFKPLWRKPTFASSLGCGIWTHFWPPLCSFCINLLASPWGICSFRIAW